MTTETKVEVFDRAFEQGSIAALQTLRTLLLESRFLIENSDKPVFDEIMGVLKRCINEVKKGL